MRHRVTKAGIAVLAAAAVLALGGCGGSGGGDEQPTVTATDQPATPSASGTASTPPAQDATATASGTAAGTGTATPSASATASGSASAVSAGAGGDATQTVDGVWLATQGDAKIQLVLGKGEANLTSAHLCGGGYTDKDGVAIKLTCMDGDKERTTGRGVLAPDGMTLTVRWTGGPTDVFTRTGLPSE